MVGAILTQNTNWKNVEAAINNIKKAGYLDVYKLYNIPLDKLRMLIKPAGFFNIKAERLKTFVKYFWRNYSGNINLMKKQKTAFLRKEILEVKGIGPETCDSILLYALNKPVFVVDAYTKRILLRHKLIDEQYTYDDVQSIFEKNLKKDVKLFNEYHALFVKLAKDKCKNKNPLCETCPLSNIPGLS
ncbi:MAG: hypothetical protein B5M53_06680 [Candidatus Cloacimonas sp. 4484_209]|nr:MAG: hypothetical protein B5M53_06680 [Candidatus Cloacimonas sp. 4484_209]